MRSSGFLECVWCGANIWRNAKTTQLVSAARETNGSKIVSISDETFGLLLIDNNFEKWQILAEGDIEDTKPAQEAETGTGWGKKKANSRRPGKYIKKAGTLQVWQMEQQWNSAVQCTAQAG